MVIVRGICAEAPIEVEWQAVKAKLPGRPAREHVLARMGWRIWRLPSVIAGRFPAPRGAVAGKGPVPTAWRESNERSS